jgi:glycerol-3-phosphate dehydrogenase
VARAVRKKTNGNFDKTNISCEERSSGRRHDDAYDIFVIGGGINGCGIARDAPGRGLSVCVAEQGDLAGATSSASTKLFHGGLRYLEYFEFRLVREALIERETLLRAMPHISWPMRFVLPLSPDMRFDSETPTSRLLSGRHAVDEGAAARVADPAGPVSLRPHGRAEDPAGHETRVAPWHARGRAAAGPVRTAYEYSDCWVEDSRLVVLNARDAEARGARIMTRTRVAQRRAGRGPLARDGRARRCERRRSRRARWSMQAAPGSATSSRTSPGRTRPRRSASCAAAIS